ncbi:hypothetical protein VTK26DRAFT_3724 [Humicola hyalothermophila]
MEPESNALHHLRGPDACISTMVYLPELPLDFADVIIETKETLLSYQQGDDDSARYFVLGEPTCGINNAAPAFIYYLRLDPPHSKPSRQSNDTVVIKSQLMANTDQTDRQLSYQLKTSMFLSNAREIGVVFSGASLHSIYPTPQLGISVIHLKFYRTTSCRL